MVADFGVARALCDEQEREVATEPGLAVGTPAYMSPEQAGADPNLSASSDQYSLACVLYEMLAGERPFSGNTEVEAFAKRFNEVASTLLRPEDLLPEVKIDMEIAIDHANSDLERMLRHFEPFGIGNPTPVLVARGVTLAAPPRVIGQDGLKLRIDTGAGELEAIGWGMADRAGEFDVANRVDIAFRLERDEYRGESRLQARIADIIPSA
jgi:single-stranded-DNA-specific exonuclease